MKVLYLCADLGIPVLGRKGAAVHVRSMVRAFDRAGHDVVLATPLLNKSPWEQPAEIEGVVLHVHPGDEAKNVALAIKTFNQALGRATDSLPGEVRRILYNSELEKRIVRRFDSHPPDFIYERLSLYATAGVSIAQQLDRPLIVEVNAPLSDEQATYRGSALADLASASERWTLTHADAVVAVSESLRRHVISQGVDANRVLVTPNGIDPQMFRPDANRSPAREKWGLGDDLVIGFVGGLRPWHGIEILPALLEELLPTHPGLRIVIAGDGPLFSSIRTEFARRGLSGRVTLTGPLPHDDVPSVIRAFDIAIAPYPEMDHDFYFSPLKIFEYMACGVPVVASKVGQIADLIRHGETGMLCRAGDLESMADACRRLLSDSNLRQRIGEAAARSIHRRYTWSHNAQQVTQLVERIRSGGQACA